VLGDQLQPRLGYRDQVQHLTSVVGDLDLLPLVALVDHRAPRAGRPAADRIEQLDVVDLPKGLLEVTITEARS
jgi:hypothetical protein